MDATLNIILRFLTDIGIVYHLESIDETCFLPGLRLKSGALVIDTDKLLYPGDILHEAGHLACMPPDIRATMNDDLEVNDMHAGGEMMAVAWSYAVCIHLGINPYVVFHEHGYKGGGESIIEMFACGNGVGVPLLQWVGMCYDANNAAQHNEQPYPHMLSWTCTKNMYTAQQIIA